MCHSVFKFFSLTVNFGAVQALRKSLLPDRNSAYFKVRVAVIKEMLILTWSRQLGVFTECW